MSSFWPVNETMLKKILNNKTKVIYQGDAKQDGLFWVGNVYGVYKMSKPLHLKTISELVKLGFDTNKNDPQILSYGTIQKGPDIVNLVAAEEQKAKQLYQITNVCRVLSTHVLEGISTAESKYAQILQGENNQLVEINWALLAPFHKDPFGLETQYNTVLKGPVSEEERKSPVLVEWDEITVGFILPRVDDDIPAETLLNNLRVKHSIFKRTV